MFDQLDLNFKNLSNTDLITTLRTIGGILSSHPRFQNEWPSFIPKPQDLVSAGDRLAAAVDAAANMDRQKIAERNDTRANGLNCLQIVGGYVILRSVGENDPSILQTSGFKSTTRSYSRNTAKPPLPMPKEVSVKHGPDSGTVTVSARRIVGAAMIELQMCLGEPAGEESWVLQGRYTHYRIQAGGLQLGKRYYFRLRAERENDVGPWSEPVSIIVI